MKICVVGLWHLGSVTAACLAKMGHDVVGLDFEAETIKKLASGKAPLFEPGLDDLIAQGISSKKLTFTVDREKAVKDAEVVWVAFDTPVDDEDRADVPFVENHVKTLFPWVKPGVLFLVSSQVPVGTTEGLSRAYRDSFPEKAASFACSPENLRLGKAISVFLNPDRIVVGVRNAKDREQVSRLLAPLSAKIEWMSIESAEMTKHAINAFLATSVSFANEIATLCESVGADAKEVERGLKSETRIGPKAYLGPGGAMAGGTLARDLRFLVEIGKQAGRNTPLVDGVLASNEGHKSWSGRKLRERLKDLQGRKIGVLGLTYKPGTDTLRRSGAVELCLWLASNGARVWAHDPAVKGLPGNLSDKVTLASNVDELLDQADGVVVATEWPDYKALKAEQFLMKMKTPLVIDPNRFLFGGVMDSRIFYAAVGMPQ